MVRIGLGERPGSANQRRQEVTASNQRAAQLPDPHQPATWADGSGEVGESGGRIAEEQPSTGFGRPPAPCRSVPPGAAH